MSTGSLTAEKADMFEEDNIEAITRMMQNRKKNLLWLALGKYNGECRFSTWLYKITCNTCYDRLRSLHHSPLDNEADYSVSANISSDDNVELAVVNKQLRELILRYTDELSPRQRLIFTLRDIEELDVPEVQIITGLSAGIIKTTLYLARKNIRNKMNQIDAGL